MRERIVAALVGTVVVVVAVMGVVRAYATAGEVERSAHATVERSLVMANVAIDERLSGGGRVTRGFLTALSAGVVNLSYRPPSGAPVSGGPPVTASDREFAASTLRSDGSELTVVRPADDIGRRVTDALLPLVLLALGLMFAAVLVGWFLARRLSRPFQELAFAAGALAHGRTGARVPHYGAPEAEAIGEALREGLARIDDLREREHEFAVTASHELRTPITALRLRVEGLGLHPDLPADARHEVEELQRGLERLSAVVLEVLATARDDRSVHGVDAAQLLVEAVERVPSHRARRRVELAPASGAILVDAPADAFTAVVAALVMDCLSSGAGLVRASVRQEATHVELVVSDEGPRRTPPDLVHARTAPVHLAETVGTAESFGGRLLVVDAPTHRYRLLVPRAVT
ncbi:two-component sensor histidine kinase [Terrabacter tumescens]|uniref:histidine kinase n=1 Tax=Terrabacter tumescens TaxID=60443 RepID=A0ABQ2HP71_9MICO|nr:HAMP domain-containing sensor histidine kinase [Terrabacter tumescens]GGM86795.1 two-component sensor histidine kinase [Terrabacter tumescens]